MLENFYKSHGEGDITDLVQQKNKPVVWDQWKLSKPKRKEKNEYVCGDTHTLHKSYLNCQK